RSSSKLCVVHPPCPPASPSETSSTPTSRTVVAASGRISSRKSASFRVRERIEIASARRTGGTLGVDDDRRAERQLRERVQGLLGRMQAACARGRAERLVRRRAPVDREAVAAAPTWG